MYNGKNIWRESHRPRLCLQELSRLIETQGRALDNNAQPATRSLLNKQRANRCRSGEG